jgi:hypothetical protein
VHVPAPLQTPVVPHDEGAKSGHSASGSAPAATGPQTPSAPEPFFVVEHATQLDVQAVSQQTPSTQKPETHSADPVQAAPFPIGAKSSALATADAPPPLFGLPPPAMRTRPSSNVVPVWWERAATRLPALVHVSSTGS